MRCERAVGLYRRLGYEIEGTRREGLRIRSEPIDEYGMGRLS
jgi:RimJ/RimL family protein N-acetyltransferase